METEGGPRFRDLDYLRGFAILAVIVIHTTGPLWWFPYVKDINGVALFNTFLHSFSLYAVPLFICISGFLMAFRYPEKSPLKRFYRKRLTSVLVPYLVFSFLYIVFFMSIGALEFDGRKIVFKILTASASFHLWFFAVLFQFYLLFPLIRRFQPSLRRSPKGSLLLFALAQILWGFLFGFVEKVIHGSRFASAIHPKIFELLEPRIFLSQIFYFGLGMVAAGYWEAFRTAVKKLESSQMFLLSMGSIFLSGALASLWLGSLFRGYFFGPGFSLLREGLRILLCILIFVLVFKCSIRMTERNLWAGGIMGNLGKYSFGIFLIHALYLKIVSAGLETIHLNGSDWQFYPLLFVITLASSYFSVQAISRLSFSGLIIGGGNPGDKTRTGAP